MTDSAVFHDSVTDDYRDASGPLTIGGGTGDVSTDAIFDAKGDLVVGTGADAADNLAVGTNGDVLTADSTATLGVKWAAPASGAPSGSAGGALDGTYPNPGLNSTVAGAGLAETSDVLSVNVDASTIEINADTLRVKASGITANEIAANAVGSSELADDAVDTNAIQNNAVTAAKVAADVATQAELDAHTGDTTDAHDASAISVADSGGYFTATDVEAALAEIGAGTVGTSFGVEVPTGTVNGVNVTFTLSAAPVPSSDLLLWKNGLLMKQGLDYTLSSATITFDSGNIPQTGDILLASVPTAAGGGSGTTIGRTQLVYRYTVTGSDKASIDTGVDSADAGDNNWTGGDVLEFMIYSRTDEAVASSLLAINLNNDSNAVYDIVYQATVNATVSGFSAAGGTFFDSSGIGGIFTMGANAASNAFGSMQFTFPNYMGTVGNKQGTCLNSLAEATAANRRIYQYALQYKPATPAAITRIKVTPATAAKKLKVGSQLLVYKRLNA